MTALLKKDYAFVRPEYDVYIHFHPANQPGGKPWEKKHSGPCVKQAYSEARQLHQSNEYRRVEIKKKYFDARNARRADRTVKIFCTDPGNFKGKMRVVMTAALYAAAFSAIICGALLAASWL